MKRDRRWLQFSLRGFLVVLTIGCLWLGWKVEKARRRGRSIDAISAAGGLVLYENDLLTWPECVGRTRSLYADLMSEPVLVFGVPISAEVVGHLETLYGINELDCEVDVDSDIHYLETLHDIPHMTIYHSRRVTDAALEQFHDKLHGSSHIVFIPKRISRHRAN